MGPVQADRGDTRTHVCVTGMSVSLSHVAHMSQIEDFRKKRMKNRLQSKNQQRHFMIEQIRYKT